MGVVFQKGQRVWDTGLCMQGLNVLAHAQMIELSIGSECGGHGRCGRDRIRLSIEDLTKVSAPTAIEKVHLKPEELEAGIRLACQCFPASNDLELRVWL